MSGTQTTGASALDKLQMNFDLYTWASRSVVKRACAEYEKQRTRLMPTGVFNMRTMFLSSYPKYTEEQVVPEIRSIYASTSGLRENLNYVERNRAKYARELAVFRAVAGAVAARPSSLTDPVYELVSLLKATGNPEWADKPPSVREVSKQRNAVKNWLLSLGQLGSSTPRAGAPTKQPTAKPAKKAPVPKRAAMVAAENQTCCPGCKALEEKFAAYQTRQDRRLGLLTTRVSKLASTAK